MLVAIWGYAPGYVKRFRFYFEAFLLQQVKETHLFAFVPKVMFWIKMNSVSFQVKKRQQRVLMILESKNIPCEIIDITEPGKESDKEFMQQNSKPRGDQKHPLPPQIFNDDEYCGVRFIHFILMYCLTVCSFVYRTTILCIKEIIASMVLLKFDRARISFLLGLPSRLKVFSCSSICLRQNLISTVSPVVSGLCIYMG